MLKQLTNELLLELFEYFTVDHILRAFQSLNSRFDDFLFNHLRNSRHFDLRSISTRGFNIVCQQYLPPLVDQIISLCLSNDDERPQQLELFLSHSFTFR